MNDDLVLFLDDALERRRIFRDFFPRAYLVTTAVEMIDLLEHHKDRHIKTLFLDHDLEGDVEGYVQRENTGMDVVMWLENNKPNIGQIVVHSMNGYAAPVMIDRLVKANYWTVGCPFFYLIHQFKKEE
jgi:hypothetical protein